MSFSPPRYPHRSPRIRIGFRIRLQLVCAANGRLSLSHSFCRLACIYAPVCAPDPPTSGAILPPAILLSALLL